MNDPTRASANRSRGWLAPTDAFLRSLLALPELAIVAESCHGERRLHQALAANPRRRLDTEELAAVSDADARENYATFASFRDALLSAGTLEAHYLVLMRSGRIAVPPIFIERTVEAIVAHLLEGHTDPFERRAAQLLHREQRITLRDGRVLAADRDAIDRLDTAGADPIGTLLRRGNPQARERTLPVLGVDNVQSFGVEVDERSFVLDLTHEVENELGHGLKFTMVRTHSGLGALACMLERWISHFLHIETTIRPLQKIDDPAWSWHIGLDVGASAILDDLYRGTALDDSRVHRLLGLFRLDFSSPGEMRTDLAGKPVYLGLAMSEEHTLRLKPQNLLLNLPVAATM